MRFYCESIDAESYLDAVESHHLCRVMRAARGFPVELFDGRGTLAEGVVSCADKKRTVISVQNKTCIPRATGGRVILAVSFAKGQRFDWLVEKCTELGVSGIFATQFERTVKQGSSSGMDRYRKIAIAAAKQSGRLFLPEISGPAKFSQALERLQETYPRSIVLFGQPGGAPVSEHAPAGTTQDIIVVIGPEGGHTDAESATLKSIGAKGVSVNKNTLRIETAATAFCAILNV